ncbi:hypothetical protein CK203_082675 [Vitis vinifera]|uniref:Uncharacterized protein n=1 Tax=Vitis vinifera TaxID=29760 RepID=A0A438BWM1_VITVI|nr:hypothetical protein CK203_082675 [Vitis vinifera]
MSQIGTMVPIESIIHPPRASEKLNSKGAERPPTSYLTPVQPCYVAQAIVSASSATISGGSISCMSSEARHETDYFPPSADNIHFMDFTEPVDRIHMLSWEDFEPEPIVVDESYEVDGVILDPQASTPFRLVPNTPLVQLTTVGPLIHQCYSIQYPFILSRDPDEMVTQECLVCHLWGQGGTTVASHSCLTFRE